MTKQEIQEQIEALEKQTSTWPAWKKAFFDQMAQREEQGNDR